jgi:hypothetical protein
MLHLPGKKTGLLVFFTFALLPLFAQQAGTTAQDTAYLRTVRERAGKIVTAMQLPDAARAGQLQEIIARQYYDLNEVYKKRDAAIAAAKTASAGSKEAFEASRLKIAADTDERLTQLHNAYLARLSALLDKTQVEQVKNGMTYNVVNFTYNGYLAMLPGLTEPQKKQILDYLTEAREHAMDAESSEKKHQWFGKYKGKINNYLSAQGYDMKKAGEDWAKRRKEAQQPAQ